MKKIVSRLWNRTEILDLNRYVVKTSKSLDILLAKLAR
jgi:hypothetical protein